LFVVFCFLFVADCYPDFRSSVRDFPDVPGQATSIELLVAGWAIRL